MENPIRKPKRLMPNIFKVFTLYIFITLGVFFGYVQFFAGTPTTTVTLPTGGVSAEEDESFSNFVSNIMSVRSLDLDGFSLSFESADGKTKIALNGTMAFVTESMNVYIDLDVVYNEKVFDVGAIYMAPELYLSVEGTTYKFEVPPMSAPGKMPEINVEQIMGLVTEYLPVDLNKITESLASIGIDINNLEGLTEKLTIETKEDEDGNHEFVIGLSNIVSAQILCDSKFNMTSASVRPIYVKGNSIKFNAPSILMNDESISHLMTEPETDVVDLTGLNPYVDYVTNLISNRKFEVDTKVSVDGSEYNVKTFVDLSDGVKALAKTNVSGFDIQLAYVDEIVYVDLGNLKLSFDINDYGKWSEQINSFVEHQTSKSVAQILNELVEKFSSEFDLQNVDLKTEALSLLAMLPSQISGSAQIESFLPNNAIEGENDFELVWKNGLSIILKNDGSDFAGATVRYDNIVVDLDIDAFDGEIEVTGDYYDVSTLLPAVSIVDEILQSKKISGTANVKYQNYEAEIDYIVDFENEILAKFTIENKLKDIAVYVCDDRALICVDEIVLEISFDEIDQYIESVESLSNVDIPELSFELKLDISTALGFAKKVLSEIELSNEENVTVLKYLDHIVKVDFENDTIVLDYGWNEVKACASVSATNENIVVPQITDKMSDVLEKAQNVKDYAESKQYAFDFAVSYKTVNVSGNAQIDLQNNIFQVEGQLSGKRLSLHYENETAYLIFDGFRTRIDSAKAISLAKVILPILQANGINTNLGFDVEQIKNTIKEKMPEITLEELVDNLMVKFFGSLSDLTIVGKYKDYDTQIEVGFVDNKLAFVDVNALGFAAHVDIVDFNMPALDEGSYYDILSAQSGTLVLNYKGQEITVNVDLDLNEQIYVRASTTLLGEEFVLTILNNKMYIEAGEIILGTDFNDAKELVEYIVETFNLTLPQANVEFDASMLETLDLNAINALSLEGLTLALAGDTLNVKYTREDLSIALTLNTVDRVNIEAPAEYEDLVSVIDKAKALKDYIEKGIYEFAFRASYNEFEFEGTFKYNRGVLELATEALGEKVYLRLQDNVIYFRYGNVKLKFEIPEEMPEMDMTALVGFVAKTLKDHEIVDVDALLAEVERYKAYSLKDWINEFTIELSGNTDALGLKVNGQENVLTLLVKISENKLTDIELTLLSQVSVVLEKTSEEGTIAEFDAEEYADYFDTARLASLLDVAKEVIENKAVKGTVSTQVEGEDIALDFLVDFEDGVKAQVKTDALGENIAVFVIDKTMCLQIGEVVVEIEADRYADYLAKIDEIFSLNLSAKVAEFADVEIDVAKTLVAAAKEIAKAEVLNADDALAIVRYLEHKITLELDGKALKVNYTNGNISVDATIEATKERVSLPVATDVADDIFEKIENVRDYIDGKMYAANFALVYKNINLSGKLQADLANERFEVSNLTIGQNVLNVRYENETAYIDYAGRKLKIEVKNVKALVEILIPIVRANGVNTEIDTDIDTTQLLIDVFGEDVSALSVTELLQKVIVDVDGNLSALVLGVNYNNTLDAQIEVGFVDNKLAFVDVNALGFAAHVDIVDFNMSALDEESYYDILSAQSGTLVLNYKGQEVVVNVDLDLNEQIYVRASTTLLGEEFVLTILNNKMYIEAGEIILGTDFNDAKELVEYIVETFNLTLPQANVEFDASMLETLDLNAMDVLSLEGLTLAFAGDTLNVTYTREDLSISLTLNTVDRVNIEAPAEYEDLVSVIDKAKALKDYIEKGIYEFAFRASYNEFEFEGTFKYNRGVLELATEALGEEVYLRLQDNVIYFRYGNVKLKFAQPESADIDFNLTDILNRITGDDFPVEIKFGVFAELVEILRDYKFEDYLENIVIDLDGKADDIKVVLQKKIENAILNSTILSAEIKFDGQNRLEMVDVNVYDILKAHIDVNNVEEGTIAEFDAAEYADYSDDFVAGVLDSLKVEEDVYAFSSDIAIRYSNNIFDGHLTVMLKYDENVDTMLGHFVPAVQIYSTALGFESYISIVNETAYIDVQGLQIAADLNETTINEVLDFVEAQFGINVDLGATAGAATEAFRVVLPAIDKIYGSWVEMLTSGDKYNGIQIKVDDSLWYGSDSRFEDMILQAYISTGNNIIMPEKVIFGVNIYDPNTTVYDDYSQYWMENEEVLTHDLNFAVYMTNFKVGSFVDHLASIFVKDSNANVVALRSNYGSTNVVDYNSYKTVLEMAETLIGFAKDMKYQVSVDGSLVTSSNTKTKLGANINVELGKLAEGEVNSSGFELFDGMYLKVLGALDITANADTNKAAEHMMEVFYESKNTSALYLTYTHGSFIGSGNTIKEKINNASNKFKAKVANSSLSETVAMILKFAGVDLGSDMQDKLGLDECNTDFRYLRSLMGMKEAEVDTSGLSQVDKILSSIEEVAKIVKNISLSKTQIGDGLYQTKFTISVDLAGDGKIATLSLIFKDERKDGVVENKFRQIVVSNFIFSGNAINATINIEDFAASNFDYSTSSSHIDISGISSFIDVAVSTINTQNWGFNGSAKVALGSYTINVGFDLYASIDENNELYMYMELAPEYKDDVTGSAQINPDYTSYILAGGSYDRRTSVLEYKNGYLTIVQYTYGIKTTALSSNSSKYDQVRGYGHGDNWIYSKDQIGNNIMKILAQGLGLSRSVYGIIEFAVSKITASPTIEEVFLGFEKTSSGYTLTINAENLTGMSGVKDMTLNIGTSKEYEIKVDGQSSGMHRFIENITTTLEIGDIISIPVTLNSVSGSSYTTAGGKVLYTNNYYRENYAKQIKMLKFETNCSQYVSPIVNAAAEEIVLPTLNSFDVDDGTTLKHYSFAGWYKTSDFREGTQYTQNIMPNDNTTLYAKWDVDIEYYRNVTFVTNSKYSANTVHQLEGTSFALPTFDAYVVDDNVTKTMRTFAGWYTTADFAEGSEADAIVPNGDITLYAKWDDMIEYYRTITFVSNSKYSSENVHQLEGTMFDLPTYHNYVVDDGVTKTTRTFAGWYTTANFAEGTKVENGVVPTFDQTLYAKWNDFVEYYRTISFVTNNEDHFDSITQLVGAKITIPTLQHAKQETIENTTTFYVFGGWYTTQNCVDGTEFVGDTMPEQDTTLYVKWNVERIVKTQLLTMYDNESVVGSKRSVVGEAIDFETFDKVLSTTKFYLEANYQTEIERDYIMPDRELDVYIRNLYTVTYNYYVITNHSSFASATKTETLYQGEALNLPTQTNDYVDYKNSSNVLDYRMYYTFEGYKNGDVEGLLAMPNYNYELTSTYSTQRKNYYTVSFNMELDYIPKSCVAGSQYVSTPATPASLRMLEGDVLDLTQSKYQITVQIWSTAISWGVKYTYKSTTWGTSKHSDYNDGGDGVTSWTVTGNVTLKPYWKKQ